MVMVIRSGCIFYQSLSAGTSIAFFLVRSFCFILWYRGLFYVKYCKDYLNLGFVLLFVAKMRYLLCILAWKSFTAFSVSITITTNMNQIHKDIKFNPTHEANGQINFLDLLLIRQPSKIEPDTFRKPINTDTNINFFSNHSLEHKMAPYIYYITRIQSLPPTPERKGKNGP